VTPSSVTERFWASHVEVADGPVITPSILRRHRRHLQGRMSFHKDYSLAAGSFGTIGPGAHRGGKEGRIGLAISPSQPPVLPLIAALASLGGKSPVVGPSPYLEVRAPITGL
jgi:hypothetical protein